MEEEEDVCILAFQHVQTLAAQSVGLGTFASPELVRSAKSQSYWNRNVHFNKSPAHSLAH
jgi:hypothetical protein